MLPFLKQRRSDGGALVTEYRKPDEGKEPSPDDDGLMAAASDLVQGIHNKDRKLVVEALKAAFEILDSFPHEEGPNVEESDEE